MSNELPWQVWTPDDLAPPPETFVPVEADNVTLTDDTPEPELTAEQQLEQELAQLKYRPMNKVITPDWRRDGKKDTRRDTRKG